MSINYRKADIAILKAHVSILQSRVTALTLVAEDLVSVLDSMEKSADTQD
jgi:hypothetical protein